MGSESLLAWSEEAEQSVIGALLMDGDAYYRVGGLVAGDFFDGLHRRVYGVMALMFEAGEAVDLVTLNERLIHERVEGAGVGRDGVLPYLGRLVQNVPGSVNIDVYADVVVARARSRQVAQLLGQAQKRLERGDVDEVVTDTMAALQAGRVTLPHVRVVQVINRLVMRWMKGLNACAVRPCFVSRVRWQGYQPPSQGWMR